MPQEFEELKQRVTRVEADLKANTIVTQSIKNDTAELVESYNAVKGGFKVLEAVGKAAKPVGYILGVVTGMALSWSSLKTTFLGFIK